MFVSKANEAVIKNVFVQALLLSPRASLFFVASSPSFFVAPSEAKGPSALARLGKTKREARLGRTSRTPFRTK
jgi:hypothetical protein